MSTDRNAEREALIERATIVWEKGWESHPTPPHAFVDWHLAETATLRDQLATAREALTKIDNKGMTSSRAWIVNIAREALAKMEEQR